jgi:hypothetical protein
VILANYAQQNRNCVREWGIAFTNPQAQFKPGWFQTFYVPDVAVASRDLSAFNHGYNTEAAWSLALKTGGIASTRQIIGVGSISATALAVKLAQASITGSGDLTAVGSLIVSLIAAISGSGTVTAANVQAFLAAVASLTGSGSVTANRSALGALLSALTGSGDIDLTPAAFGELSADLVVTGTGLTTANVGEAVWAKVIEAGFTAEEVLRLIAAVTAGDATGLESGSPSFEGLDETTTRVSGTYSAGTRNITTRDGS